MEMESHVDETQPGLLLVEGDVQLLHILQLHIPSEQRNNQTCPNRRHALSFLSLLSNPF